MRIRDPRTIRPAGHRAGPAPCRYTPNIRTFLPALPTLATVLHQHISPADAIGLAVLGIFAGWLGAVVGIGGGVVIVPALVLLFHFDTKVAVASSLVAVVATSAAAGSAYAGSGQLNMRLALTLEIATTMGGLAGGVVAVLIAPTVIDGLFALVMLVTAFLVLRGRDEHGEVVGEAGAVDVGAHGDPHADSHAETVSPVPTVPDAAPAMAAGSDDPVLACAEAAGGERAGAAAMVASGKRVGWEERGRLAGAYHDLTTDALVTYRAIRLWIGWAVSFVAGLLSGLLGVGGGFLKVPAMHLGMKVPIKVSAATSNFMIGVTAVASLFVYFARGYVLPFAAAPVALGIAVGAFFGAKSSQRVSGRTLGRILAGVLILVAVQMGLKALGIANV